MRTPAGPRAISVRRVGLVLVLAVCVLDTVVARRDATVITVGWLVFFCYLAFCAEPLRRVLRTAEVSWAVAVTYLLTALACVGVICCLPVTTYGQHTRHVSVLGLLAGRSELSRHAEGLFADSAWALSAALAAGTLTLWFQVLRLARRTEWRSIDHHVGDGAMLTGATLQEPAGTAVTRPVERSARDRQ